MNFILNKYLFGILICIWENISFSHFPINKYFTLSINSNDDDEDDDDGTDDVPEIRKKNKFQICIGDTRKLDVRLRK